MTYLISILALSLLFAVSAAAEDDPYLWLEEVGGTRALDWVKERNAQAESVLTAQPGFRELETRIRAILDSDANIPFVGKHGEHYYNLWRDRQNPRGLWRRTSLAEYRKPQPAWETVLDVDQLAKSEGENWVWKGADFLEPATDRCLIYLSRGGADASVAREFDTVRREFVADGFVLPEAKMRVAWADRDTLLVGTDFGPGSMTESGYPRVLKSWRRGQPLAGATPVYEGQAEDVSVEPAVDATPGYERAFVVRNVRFYESELFWFHEGKLDKVPKPEDAEATAYREWLLIHLRREWRVGSAVYPSGALLATRFADFMAGGREFQMLFAPSERRSLASFALLRDHILLNEMENVASRLALLTPRAGTWVRADLPGVPPLTTASAWAVEPAESNDYFLTMSGYLTPTTLALGTVEAAQDAAEPAAPAAAKTETLKQAPAFFETAGLAVSQHQARSADGTLIPYFQVARADLSLDGSNPTLLYGYGGFEIPLRPGYSAASGVAWLERGGVYVVANIRGGGEFGPAWHQAALKANRHRAYEDFAAVAEDLIARKVTRPARLGIQGGSNGGLLVGNLLTTRPELFGAVVCQVPLLDMKRYTKLLAGASWVAEYGDPDDPAEWEFLQRYSPYHRVQSGQTYPPTLFLSSTRDDRVHPGHARKMVARMLEQGHTALYYENMEGGHGAAADNRQRAFMSTLAYAFLWARLND